MIERERVRERERETRREVNICTDREKYMKNEIEI